MRAAFNVVYTFGVEVVSSSDKYIFASSFHRNLTNLSLISWSDPSLAFSSVRLNDIGVGLGSLSSLSKFVEESRMEEEAILCPIKNKELMSSKFCSSE